jgi:hypothetical protein
MQPPQWSMCAWLITTASISFGSIPACFMLLNSLPVGRPEQLEAPHAGVEQDELVAGVDDECVLLQHHVLERQEVVGELLSHSGFVKPTKLSSGLPSGSVPSVIVVSLVLMRIESRVWLGL